MAERTLIERLLCHPSTRISTSKVAVRAICQTERPPTSAGLQITSCGKAWQVFRLRTYLVRRSFGQTSRQTPGP